MKVLKIQVHILQLLSVGIETSGRKGGRTFRLFIHPRAPPSAGTQPGGVSCGPLVRACRGPRPVCTCSQRSPLQSPVALRACSWDTSAAFWAGASVPQEPAPGPPRGDPFLRSDASASLIPVQSGCSGPMSWGGGRGEPGGAAHRTSSEAISKLWVPKPEPAPEGRERIQGTRCAQR